MKETDGERESESFTRVVEWCVSGANDLRFVGREFRKRGEELRNDRTLSLVEIAGRERHR